MKLSPAMRVALWPASLVFGGLVRIRVWLYRSGILRQRRLKGTIISVGNLTVGGTGKTPMVIWVAQKLAAEGKRVGILTRGYRSVMLPAPDGEGSSGGERRVSDEMLVLESHLGQKVPIGVGADRYREGCLLEQQGVEWFVLDDGFQHVRLARDVEIVLVDATDPFGGGLLPAGRLREPRSALGRADVIVITRREKAPGTETVIRCHTQAHIFYAQTELTGVLRIHPGPVAPATEDERERKLFAFCGTGNPGAFFEDLRRWGIQVVGEMVFPDHHLYAQCDVSDLERFAQQVGARGLVCTEKDILNLSDVRFESLPVYVCRIALRPSEPEQFWQTVLSTVARKRPGVLP